MEATKASGEPRQERGGTLSGAKLLGIQLYTGARVEDSICCQVTPTDERASQSNYETVPRSFFWSGDRGTQHVLKRLDRVLPVGRNPYGNKRFRQLDTKAITVFHGKTLDQ